MKLIDTTGGLTERMGDLKSLDIIKNAGFDGYDYDLYYITNEDNILYGDKAWSYIKSMKEHGEEIGLPCMQAHAPFPSAEEGAVYEGIIRSIEYAAFLGAQVIVVHPICARGAKYFSCREELYESNIRLYKSLLPYAEKNNIKISLENLYGVDKIRNVKIANSCSHSDEFARYIDELDSSYVTACLDIGHTAIVSDDPASMIYKMGDRLGALHVHDVDCVNDNHTLPYCGKLNWNEICKALADINYSGNFTFEAGNFYSVYMDDDFIPVATEYAQKVGRSLIKKIEEYKKQA